MVPSAQLGGGALTDALNEQTRSAVYELTAAADRARRAVGRRVGIGVTELIALALLRKSGPLSPKDIGVRLHLTTSAITAVLDRLERGGFAARTANPSDRRSLLVEITPTGNDRLRRASDITATPLSRHLEALLAEGTLTTVDLGIVIKVMDQLTSVLEQVAEEA